MRINLRACRAEQVPLPTASCDVALMHLVLHHVQDRAAAAREIARMLRPGGWLLIQSDFPGTSPPRRYWHRYFPAAHPIEVALFPALGEVTAIFSAAVSARYPSATSTFSWRPASATTSRG